MERVTIAVSNDLHHKVLSYKVKNFKGGRVFIWQIVNKLLSFAIENADPKKIRREILDEIKH